MAVLRAKRGDSITLSCQRKDSAGVAVSLSGVNTLAQIKRGPLSQDFTTEVVAEATGIFLLTLTKELSATLDVGRHRVDIEYSEGANRVSTETFYIDIIEDVTIGD